MESNDIVNEELLRIKGQNQELLNLLHAAEEETRELDRKSYNLFILYHASRALGSILDVEELLQLTIDMTTEVMGVEWGLLYLMDEEQEHLVLRKEKMVNSCAFPERLRIGDGIAEWTTGKVEAMAFEKLAPGTPFLSIFPDMPNFKLFSPSLVTPLFHKGRFMGLLILGEKFDRTTFTQNDLDLLNTIASLSATSFMNAHLYEMAIQDGTTKLFVARYFRQRLNEEVKRASRYAKPLTLIMLDLDNFKEVNDAYGHPHGDQLLAHIGSIIRKCSREDVDIPCRYGGEEFALVLPETAVEGAYQVAERIRKSVEATLFLKENVRVTVSAGVASYPLHASSPEELVEKADLALYESKRLGKNKVTVHNKALKGVSI